MKSTIIIEHEQLKIRFHQLWHQLMLQEIPSAGMRRTFSCLRDCDVQALLNANVAEEAAPSLPATAAMFLVPEPAKTRARIITWTIATNQIAYDSEFSLKSVETIVEEVRPETWALTADLCAAFYQVLIPLPCRHRFVFSHKNKLYQMCRLPMGARQSAEIVQTLLPIIVQTAIRAANAETDVYVRDNRFENCFVCTHKFVAHKYLHLYQ